MKKNGFVTLLTVIMLLVVSRISTYGAEAYAYTGVGGAYAYVYGGNAGYGSTYVGTWPGESSKKPKKAKKAKKAKKGKKGKKVKSSQNAQSAWPAQPVQPVPSDQPAQGYQPDQPIQSSQPAPSANEHLAPYGTYGVLRIYGTNVNTTLDLLNTEYALTYYAQAVVDDPTKAAVLDYSYKLGSVSKIIADHNDEGFEAMFYLEPGATCEIFYTSGGSQRFVLREKRQGINNGDIIVDGKRIEEMRPSNWICMYTCNPGSSYYVTVTFWEPI